MSVMDTINLLPDSIARARTERRWRARWTGAVVVAAVVAGAFALAMGLGSDSGLRAMQAEVARLETQDVEAGLKLPQLQAQVAAARKIAGAATVLDDRPDWSLLLASLERERGDGVVLTRVVVVGLDGADAPAAPGEALRVRVVVTGIGATLGDIQGCVLRVERSGVFDSVSPIETRPRRVGSRDFVEFEIEGRLGPEAIASGETP
ncbi:MAG: hypothetical protein DHS20C14_08730 [Phycisphaeraceae bacterium]|nr:MAG: hypothetical protein DHS20C14_08730 [Phycisphaeraceae bacterium]